MADMKGFTIIEILVVIFIVTIMAGITVVNLPRFAQTADIDTEARRIKILIEMAREEALLQANELGFKPSRDGYAFYSYDAVEQAWQEFGSRPFDSRKLPEEVTLDLKVEDEKFVLGENQDRMPPVLLLSSGETTPFELTISANDVTQTLVSNGIGELVWKRDETIE